MKSRSKQQDSHALAVFISTLLSGPIYDLCGILSREKLSMQDACLLAYLMRGLTPTMTDISRNLRFSTAAATGLVDKLERIELLERIHPADDRRKVRVRITNEGRIFFLDRIQKALEEVLYEASVNAARIRTPSDQPDVIYLRPTFNLSWEELIHGLPDQQAAA